MQTESIFATLLAAAAFLKQPVQDVAARSMRDSYEAVKAYLHRKFGEHSEAADALELATAKPESLMRKAVLAEEAAGTDLENDAELSRLISHLAALLPPLVPAPQTVRVTGRGNRVQVAGRDILHTEKIVRRNTITPDERHLGVEQRECIRDVIRELAPRLGAGGVAAAHAMLQRRFDVPSYLLIPRERYADALSFLRQQRAIHRSRLHYRDPIAFANDLYRAIFAGARELGWDGARVYQFAAEKLGLENPLSSLKTLGAVQLKTLAEAVQREVRAKRKRESATAVADPISGDVAHSRHNRRPAGVSGGTKAEGATTTRAA